MNTAVNLQNGFDIDAMLAEAFKITGGLRDFGTPDVRPGLVALCTSLDADAKLSDTGRYLMRQKLVTQLANRLRIEDYFAKYPEIADEVIAAPIVIVGLPRTGTTKLHRLLSRDPRFHTMAFWESQFPVPFDGESLNDPAPRIREGHGLCEMMTTAMPKLAAIHPMFAEEADEEVMLTEHTFMSSFNAYADVPSYMQWLDAQNQLVVYQFLRRGLQFLQWQKRQRGITAERWVLKAPHHLLRMDLLLEAFPGARVILTHRDPLQSIPSIASFIHTLWGIYSSDASAERAGHEWSALMKRALAHTGKIRRAAPDQFLDVQFRDTVKEPMDVVHTIYRWLGLQMPPASEAAMREWLAADAKTHQGGHDYSAATFGLSDDQLQRDFADYRARHVATATATATPS
ncbi:sulfotransferase family protein [Solimonas marina]|uniref:Sulfotransferase n=1 Tax=Solimonas marina TaxID=2714601 RepID=A0A969W8F6_9GAMM|nr:sulfotransferase [Solimonas marina]NKF20866.1 sulfotransferase [Solimonas marina]